MLSKEEIESSFKIIETICDEEICLFNKTIVQGNVNQIKRYIDQLELDKQKLIEKLEKRRKQNNDKYGKAIDTDEFPEMYEYSGQVEEDDYLLSIVKGVENV